MQKKRTKTDEVRTKFWFSCVSIETDRGSAFKLGRHIDPGAYSTHPDGGTQNPNKFRKYKSGKNTPQPDLVNKVEDFAPGSTYVLNMPLWKPLQPNFGVKQRNAAIKQLPGEITAKVSGFDRFTVDGVFPDYREISGKKLVRMGSYDALCMLMIYWRIDNEGTNHPNRMEIAVNIYHLLLILSGHFSYYEQCESVFTLFEHQVFDRARLNGYRFDLDYEKFSRNADRLNKLYPFVKNAKTTKAKKRNLAIGMTLQKASKDFKLNVILNDIFDFDETVPFPEREIVRKLTYHRLCADWASKVLFENHQESLIDTIKKHVKNDPTLTESDELVLITMAQYFSRLKTI